MWSKLGELKVKECRSRSALEDNVCFIVEYCYWQMSQESECLMCLCCDFTVIALFQASLPIL